MVTYAYKLTNMSVRDVEDVIRHEGLGEAIRDWLSSDKIRDKKLGKLVDEAKIAMLKVQDYLE